MWISTDEEPQYGKYAGRRIRIRDIGDRDAYRDPYERDLLVGREGTVLGTDSEYLVLILDGGPIKKLHDGREISLRHIEVEFIDDPDNNY